MGTMAISLVFHLKRFANKYCVAEADLCLHVHFILLDGSTPKPLLDKEKEYYKYWVYRHYMGWAPNLSVCKAWLKSRFCKNLLKRNLHFELRRMGPEDTVRPMWISEHTNALDLLRTHKKFVRSSEKEVPIIRHVRLLTHRCSWWSPSHDIYNSVNKTQNKMIAIILSDEPTPGDEYQSNKPG